MSFKYPHLGSFNLVERYIIDVDVTGMLSILKTMPMRLGDVSMFIEARKLFWMSRIRFNKIGHRESTQTTYEP